MKAIFTLICCAFMLQNVTSDVVSSYTSSSSVFPEETNVMQFAAEFYEYVRTCTPYKNIAFSPFIIQNALAVLLCGAEQNTTRLISAGIFTLNKTCEQTAIQFQSLIKPLQKISTLYTVNGILISDDYVLHPIFEIIAIEQLNAELKQTDFSYKLVAKHVNHWVNKSTDNAILNIVEPSDFSPSTRMMLINALYYTDEWSIPFSETNRLPFFSSCKDKKGTLVEMMYTENSFNYGYIDDLNAYILQLTFNSKSGISLFIMLPKLCHGLSELENRIRDFDFGLTKYSVTENIVRVSLPKFTIDIGLGLQPALEGIGLGVIFTDAADFGGMIQAPSNNSGLYVSNIIHKSSINVNEYGLSAFPQNVILPKGDYIKVNNPNAKVFNANHPFMFVLTTSQEVLMIGKYAQAGL